MTKKNKLPKKLLYIPSSDKNDIERWSLSRDMLDIPNMRIVIAGKPGCGKTMMIKNIIMRTQASKKPYERIFVLHQDKKAKEYDDIGAEILTELPENDFWMGYSSDSDDDEDDEPPVRPKTLMVLDDICFSDLKNNKHQYNLLDRLCGFISSHCRVNLAFLNQDIFSVNPPIIRKCANVWCLWKPSDTDELKTISRRCGMKSKYLQELFNNHVDSSIMIDLTPHSPYPVRIDGYNSP